MSRDPILEQALSQRMAVTKIAKSAGISTAAVSQWRRVPRKHVGTVSAITGIAREVLRPDLLDPPEVAAPMPALMADAKEAA